jgi:hypothetical protein
MANNEEHKYQAQGPNDKRSPCPALNTLAITDICKIIT